MDWQQITTPDVSSRYGAPMGRHVHPAADDGTQRLYCRRIPLHDGGCYDAGGAYWGCRPYGLSLYCVYTATEAVGYYDATSRIDALRQHKENACYEE